MKPHIIQIVTGGADDAHIYGLEASGKMYVWKKVFDNPEIPETSTFKLGWVELVDTLNVEK